ncbi:polysaccharide biosynthesis domain protein [Buttiauxella gaviniae ATCC 51604]|uniref:Polysaccharide biosynthesis domain protein n=1 Tax=Buttiauxella gaviniae ATCC 51604 TaxID=1354253 RepID=A0A1B7I4W4_9ENTR|nr:oligosaccharide flippase family protein [Buttiauxella gaviniae]OAT23447.1 polysaccharide biosynthesis domain protein [Buttiauxella gaviniae ATCC 51604]
MKNRLKTNVIFNYIGQIYLAVIGIVILPFYLKLLDAESYGLIAFFTLLQSWMLLFDLGMSPTLGREVAINNNGTNASKTYILKLARSLETIFFIIAVVMIMTSLFLSHYIAIHWLKLNNLNVTEVANCLLLMGGMLGLRWFVSLYKSGINGFEQQVWVNVINVIIITLRLPFPILLFMHFNMTITGYFIYQILLTIVEVLLYGIKFYSNLYLGRLSYFIKIPLLSPSCLKKTFPFMIGTAYTTSIWLFLTQLDKLLLSSFLKLSDFGYFMLVITLVNGITMLATPVNNAILPRMAYLLNLNKKDEMLGLYHKATRFISSVIFPIVFMLCLNAEKILYAWTKNTEASHWGREILPLYALGNGLLALISFQYFLQYAHGKLKLHIVYNTVAFILLIPLIYFFSRTYGAYGTGWIWLCLNIFTLFIWSGFVHHVYAPKHHMQWVLRDITLPLVISFSVIFCMSRLYIDNVDYSSRVLFFLMIGMIVSFAAITCLIFSFWMEINSYLKRRRV